MYRVIVVDDEPFTLEGMRLMIDWNACGFTLAGEAGTAQEALHLVERVQPDLVITDIRMPGLLGTDLAGILSRQYPETVVLFISGYRDFSYAQAAIRTQVFGYLLKPIDSDEVHKALCSVKAELDRRRIRVDETNVPAVRDHAIRRIAYGDSSEEALAQCGQLFHVEKQALVSCIVVEFEKEAQSDEVMNECSKIALDSFRLSPALIGVLLRGDTEPSALLQMKKALSNTGISVSIGVGRSGHGPEGLRDSLRQAMLALGPWFSARDGLRLYRPYDDGLPGWLLNADIAGLENALRQKHPDAVAKQISIVENACNKKKPDAMYLRVMAYDLEAILTLTGANAQAAFMRPLWRTEVLDRQAWIQSFIDSFRALCETDESDVSATQRTVQKVLRYIDEEYASNVSIGQIAARLYINPAYLGQLVRRITGKTFHKHLLNARMTQASHLLRQTQMTVGEVALAVGIHDVDYFSAQFRRQFGISPNVYRTDAGEVEIKP